MHEQEQQPTPEQEREQPSPRIYVASLSDYNAGVLHGAWLDAAREVDELQSDIETMLAASPTNPGAEEWAVHDYEGWGALRLGEYEPIERLTRIAAGIAEHGPAYAAGVESSGSGTDDLDGFEDAYRGEWTSLQAYAEEVLEDLGAYQAIDSLGDWLSPYVHLDAEAFAQDVSIEMSVVDSPDGGVFIFDPS